MSPIPGSFLPGTSDSLMAWGAKEGGSPGILELCVPSSPGWTRRRGWWAWACLPACGKGQGARPPGLGPPPGVCPGPFAAGLGVEQLGLRDPGGAITFPHGPPAQCTRATSVFNRPRSTSRSRAPWPEDSKVSSWAGWAPIPVTTSMVSSSPSSRGPRIAMLRPPRARWPGEAVHTRGDCRPLAAWDRTGAGLGPAWRASTGISPRYFLQGSVIGCRDIAG